VVADPNGFGRVQSPVDGRIEALATGLPFVGQKVIKGQILATVVPVIPTADQNVYAGTVGELDTQIMLAEQKLGRISRIPGTIPQRDIDDTRTTLEGLRKRRASVRSSQGEPQPLTAPITGVISMSAAVPGQLASARDVIFEIVDPTRLWVEAIAFDPRIVSDIVEASAVSTTGETFKLNLVGRSLTLRQQGTPVNFSIVAPIETLAIGRPMTVILKTASKRDGMILPQAAVVRGANGVSPSSKVRRS
jgi:membrane fusion protein, heavy metal efflux system